MAEHQTPQERENWRLRILVDDARKIIDTHLDVIEGNCGDLTDGYVCDPPIDKDDISVNPREWLKEAQVAQSYIVPCAVCGKEYAGDGLFASAPPQWFVLRGMWSGEDETKCCSVECVSAAAATRSDRREKLGLPA